MLGPPTRVKSCMPGLLIFKLTTMKFRKRIQDWAHQGSCLCSKITQVCEPRGVITWLVCCCCRCSVAQLCPTLCDPSGLYHTRLPCSSASPRACSNSCPLSRLPTQPSHPLLSSSPAFNLSQYQCLFQRVGSSHQVAKVLVFSLSISPSNEYSGLISFRIDWFDLLAVQETLRSLLQHHSLKASILQGSAFFMVQIWHPYMTTGKNHSFD